MGGRIWLIADCGFGGLIKRILRIVQLEVLPRQRKGEQKEGLTNCGSD